MELIALTRIANVLPYVTELKAARLRMDQELRRRFLPTVLEDDPDGFIPKIPFFDCVQSVAQHACLGDIGYRAFRRWRLTCLDPGVLARVRTGQTLAARLQTFASFGRIEDTQLDVDLEAEGAATRIVLSRAQRPFDGFLYGEWIQIAAALGIVRDAVGPRAALQVTLQARYRPCPEAYTEFRDAIVVGARQTSIVVPSSLLTARVVAAPTTAQSPTTARTQEVLGALNSGRLAPRFKLLLGSYLKEGYPPIGLAAELARTSVRSLQRELAQSGVSYSDLVQQVRFEHATRLLSEDRTKVIDVALSLGYEDASHFSRAFKRITGVSPRQYRSRSVTLSASLGAKWPDAATAAA